MSFFKKLFGKALQPETQSGPSIIEFRDAVIQKMAAQTNNVRVSKVEGDPSALSIETNDGMTGQCNLTNFFQNFVLFDGMQENAVQEVVTGIMASVQQNDTVSADMLLPLLRTSEYLGNTSDETRKKISQPFQGKLLEICMADLPTALRGLTDDDLGTLNIEKPLAAARDNMRGLLSGLYRNDELGFAVLYSIEDHAHLAPSLVLFEEFWKQADVEFPDGCLIALPRRDQLFLLDLADPNVIENAQELVRITLEDDFNILTDELYIRKAGQISVLPVS